MSLGAVTSSGGMLFPGGRVNVSTPARLSGGTLEDGPRLNSRKNNGSAECGLARFRLSAIAPPPRDPEEDDRHGDLLLPVVGEHVRDREREPEAVRHDAAKVGDL